MTGSEAMDDWRLLPGACTSCALDFQLQREAALWLSGYP